jgi:CheY-like chemotaxis protein
MLFENSGGFDFCIEARSGMEALEKTRHLLPNLVVLDLVMPGMDGLQLARNLRAIRPELPIFLLTGDRDLHIEDAALSCGINGVFSKLDDLESLLANAHAICGIT